MTESAAPLSNRLNSVDFFRGLTMFLLAGESTALYEHFNDFKGGFMQFLATQLIHHKWHGLHFWDLIQPFFMFIVGVSIPFAVAARRKKGDTNQSILIHAIKRSLILLLLGWGLYCLEPGRILFSFQNVLAQLAVTYLVAFLIRDKSFSFQIIFTLLLLLMIDLAYRFFPVEGFNHPWVNYENLGAWFNNSLKGIEEGSEWATLNFVSTTAHTVWGLICGRLLMGDKPAYKKISLMVTAGVLALIIGYSLDWMNITPIIKKIATSSFVFVSGGYAILVLTAFYWMIDVKQWFAGGFNMFKVVGMNSIAIYMFFSLGGSNFLSKVISILVIQPFFSWTHDPIRAVLTSCTVWAALWGICYWLYKNRLFIKI
jgi:predicted acyltransferase